MGLCHNNEKPKPFEKHHPVNRSMRIVRSHHVQHHNMKNISERSFRKIVVANFKKYDANKDEVLEQ